MARQATTQVRPAEAAAAQKGFAGQAAGVDVDRPSQGSAVAVEALGHDRRVGPGERAFVCP